VTAARETAKLDDLGRRLTTLFEREIWEDSLEELRTLFGADCALAYRLSRFHKRYEFEFLHKALAPAPEVRETFDRFTRFVVASTKPWPAYNPEKPAVWQRNRAVSERELSKMLGTTNRLARLHQEMGGGFQRPDQIRVLVCDGGRMLGWVGVVGRRRFGRGAVQKLQRIVPALRSRLVFDELARDHDRLIATAEAAFDAISAPSLLVGRSGRVEHLNEPARILEKIRAEVFAAARNAPEKADPRCEVRPVKVRGLPTQHLVTIRPREPEELDREAAERRWKLTPRQSMVLRLVAQGLSNKQVGSHLAISEGTVELHVSALLKKAGVPSRAGLVALYLGGSSAFPE
jgi:DNA-binding CsgD family transcriptional regulator